MHKLAQLIAERISTGLKRKAVTDCARWAEQYRVMGQPFPGPWQWDHHPWLYDMHIAEGERLIGMKAAQMGFTQWALNKTFYAMDVHGLNVLYILPSESDASDFSADRFDKALENSDYLSRFFSDVKNVGHKRAGNSSLFVRGSKSRSKLKSIDTALIVFDEMAEMNNENVVLALERQSGQRIEMQQVICVSTPTIAGKNIDEQYQMSTQEHYMFKCPSCSRLTEFCFPDSIIITADKITDLNIRKSHYICKECKALLPHELKPTYLKNRAHGGTGHYVPNHSDRDWRGFYINQMYAPNVPAYKLAELYLLGLNDPTIETEFYNSKMGLCHMVEGAQINDSDIQKCTGTHRKHRKIKESIRTLGIDVGRVCHYWVDEWHILDHYAGRQINDEAEPYCIMEGKTSGQATDFNELDALMRDWEIDGCIIDAEPERRVAYQFATRHWGKILLCDFLWSQQGRAVVIAPEEERTIKVNRTSWMDLALGRFRTKTIHLPSDLSVEAATHIKVPARTYKKDKWGNNYGTYESKTDDHFALARVYSEIALGLAISRRKNTDIHGVY